MKVGVVEMKYDEKKINEILQSIRPEAIESYSLEKTRTNTEYLIEVINELIDAQSLDWISRAAIGVAPGFMASTHAFGSNEENGIESVAKLSVKFAAALHKEVSLTSVVDKDQI